MILKVFSMGFVFTKGAYLRDGWNVLDFLVVVMGFVSLVTPSNLTAIRAFRAMRPLRTINRVKRMKVLVNAMLGSLPLLVDVFLMCAFTFFIFSLVAVQLFAGVLRFRCGAPDLSGAYSVPTSGGGGGPWGDGGVEVEVALLANVSYQVPDYQADLMCSGALSSEVVWFLVNDTPVAVPGKPYAGRVCQDGMYCTLYSNPDYGLLSYDNILWSWLTIFQHITLSGWTDVMYMVMDAVNYWVWIFYVALIIFGAFFMVNLALAVLATNFSAADIQQAGQRGPEGSEESSHRDGVTEGASRERSSSEGARKRTGVGGLAISPARLVAILRSRRGPSAEDPDIALCSSPPPRGMGRFRSVMWQLAVSRALEFTTAAVILINTAVMCINWYGMPSSVESATTYINYGLTVYFVVEVGIRLIAFGFARYFGNGMNIFDFVVTSLAVAEMVVGLLPGSADVGPLSVLRAFRLLRVFRLARNWRELNALICGMFRSIVASTMLVVLMLLFLLVAALVGMQVFGYMFMFCDYVEGASPVCPLGQEVWGGCPNHFYCYLPCSDEQYGDWIDAPGSFYNGLAYCDRFCATSASALAAAAEGNATSNATSSSSAAVGGCEYLAMVGKSQVPRANFDNVFWAMYTVFQLLTGENWNDIMTDGMRAVSPWTSLYFVGVILVGNYLVFNLFIAILLDNLNSRMEEAATAAGGGQRGLAPREGGDKSCCSSRHNNKNSKKEERAEELSFAALPPPPPPPTPPSSLPPLLPPPWLRLSGAALSPPKLDLDWGGGQGAGAAGAAVSVCGGRIEACPPLPMGGDASGQHPPPSPGVEAPDWEPEVGLLLDQVGPSGHPQRHWWQLRADQRQHMQRPLGTHPDGLTPLGVSLGAMSPVAGADSAADGTAHDDANGQLPHRTPGPVAEAVEEAVLAGLEGAAAAPGATRPGCGTGAEAAVPGQPPRPDSHLLPPPLQQQQQQQQGPSVLTPAEAHLLQGGCSSASPPDFVPRHVHVHAAVVVPLTPAADAGDVAVSVSGGVAQAVMAGAAAHPGALRTGSTGMSGSGSGSAGLPSPSPSPPGCMEGPAAGCTDMSFAGPLHHHHHNHHNHHQKQQPQNQPEASAKAGATPGSPQAPAVMSCGAVRQQQPQLQQLHSLQRGEELRNMVLLRSCTSLVRRLAPDWGSHRVRGKDGDDSRGCDGYGSAGGWNGPASGGGGGQGEGRFAPASVARPPPPEPPWRQVLEGRSLLLMGPDSSVRVGAAWLVHQGCFEAAILVLILASCVALVLDTPSLDPNTRLAFALRICDYIFTGAFTLEAALKIVAFGFAFTGRHAYIRSGWNVLDLSIVLLGWALIAVQLSGLNQTNLHMLRVLRTLRALRPLRAVRRVAGLRVVVDTLFAVLPAMVNVALVCIFFYLIFAILAVNLFKGKLYNCIDAASGERIDPFYVMPYGQQLTRTWCDVGSQTITQSAYYSALNVTMPPYTLQTQWINPGANFDNVGIAMLTLFQAATLSLWVDITFSAVDAVGVDKQPLWNHSPGVIVFFVLFIVVCSFFVLNLFIGVTLDKFAELQLQRRGPSPFLTPQQLSWVRTQRLLLRAQADYVPRRPTGRLRGVLYRLVAGRVFEGAMLVVILLNVVFIALVHYDMSDTWQDVMSYSNVVFTFIFVAEAALKLTAFGPLGYFRDGWNCFDCFVAAASVVSVALDFSDTRNMSFMPVLRVLRVVRVVRLIRHAVGMQKLLFTLITSLPALANVGGVMALFFFMFGVIGVNLFSGIKHGDNLDDHANFDSLSNALLLLFRMLTGEGWDAVMQDCMTTQECVLVLQDVNVTLPYPSDPAFRASSATGFFPPSPSAPHPSAETPTFPDIAVPAPAGTTTTILGGTYLDPSDPLLALLPPGATDNQCALSPAAAMIYFPLFVVLCSFILLQLVIGVMRENLLAEEEEEDDGAGEGSGGRGVPRAAIDSFARAWGAAAAAAAASGRGCRGGGLLHVSLLPRVVAATEPPLGARGVPNQRLEVQRLLLRARIPLYEGDQVSFIEALHSLAGCVCGTPLPPGEREGERLTRKLSRRLPREEPHPQYTAAHYRAATTVAAAVRAFLVRHQLRKQMMAAAGAADQAPSPAAEGAAAPAALSPDVIPAAAGRSRPLLPCAEAVAASTACGAEAGAGGRSADSGDSEAAAENRRSARRMAGSGGVPGLGWLTGGWSVSSGSLGSARVWRLPGLRALTEYLQSCLGALAESILPRGWGWGTQQRRTGVRALDKL